MKQIAEIIEGRSLDHAASKESVREAVRRMSEWNVGAIAEVPPPARGRQRLVIGMLSLRDLLQIDDEHQRRKASFVREMVTYSPVYES